MVMFNIFTGEHFARAIKFSTNRLTTSETIWRRYFYNFVSKEKINFNRARMYKYNAIKLFYNVYIILSSE